MTTATFQQVPLYLPEQPDCKYELQINVEGHALSAPHGQDLVCAAESILVHSFAALLAGVSPKTVYDFSVDGEDGSGAVYMRAIPTKRGWCFMYGAFQLVMTGFFLLAKWYPKHVSIRISNNTEKE